jgi:alpha-D-ribose 1-methylphosphonate 5-triphosphate synthase subunit PhnH
MKVTMPQAHSEHRNALPAAARGFENPVLDAQATFRGVLSALAEPGTVHTIATPAGCCPGFSPAMTALALTLADFETQLWLDVGSQSTAAAYVRFQTGAQVAASPAHAAFALITQPAQMPLLSAFAQGTLAYPDTSCTIVIDVRSIETTHGLRLTGPGIITSRQLHLEPLPQTFAADIAANRAAFPLGVDLIFCRGTSVVGLPRSTHVASQGD